MNKKISEQHPSVSQDAEFLRLWTEVERVHLRMLQAQRMCYTLWAWTAAVAVWSLVAIVLKVVFS